MRIGIDVDGTLTNIIDSVIAYGQQYELENNLGNELFSSKSDQADRVFSWGNEIGNKFWRDNFLKISEIQPRPLVVKYLSKLREEGYEIYIITARTNEEISGDARAVTEKWLKKNKIPYDKVFANALEKGPVCKQNNIDFFIDDLPKNCDDVSAEGIKTFMMNSLSNEDYHNDKVTRVYSIVDFYRQITGFGKDTNSPRTYTFNVTKTFFNKLKRGKKTVELRLNDLRRKKIKPGDIIKFCLDQEPNKFFFAKVKEIIKYKDFVELLTTEGKAKCGFEDKTIEQANTTMHKFYTEKEIEKYGVVAIRLEK